MISTFCNLRLTVINFASQKLLPKSSHNSHFSHVFFNRKHLVPLFHSSYDPKFLKHMIPGLWHVLPTKQCFDNALSKTIWSFVSRQYC